MKLLSSTLQLMLALAGLGPALPTASAHVGVGGDRTLNGGAAIDGLSVTNNLRTVSSRFGWADATDDDWGDSHRLTAFKFALAAVQSVTITVERRAAAGQTGPPDTFLPAFSLFTTPLFVSETHDSSPPTASYLAGLGAPAREGALAALSPWKIFNDDGAEMNFDTLIGHAADGHAANYGNAPGIHGDGTADGRVTATFANLGAGDYYLFVGGAEYAGQLTETATYPVYGIGVTVSAAPEPAGGALLLLGAGTLSLLRHRRS